MEFKQIIFSPFHSNVLDFVGKPGLVTRSGQAVTISRSGLDFSIQVENLKPYLTPDNIAASYFLNVHEVGEML